MKPSREEVLRMAKECGANESFHGDPMFFGIDRIERFAAAMYEAGAAARSAELERKVKHLDLMDRVQIRQIGLLEARIKAERAVSDKLVKLVKELQWSDHHYDPAHSHSHSCPICGGCDPEGDLRSVTSDYGHSKGCLIGDALAEVASMRAQQAAVRKEQE